VPDPLPPAAVVSHEMSTLRSPLLCSMVPSQPLTFRVPLPPAIRTPLQLKLYSPVMALISTKFPGLVSSCKQKLDTAAVNEHDAVFPAASVAVQVTVVVPTGKVEPDGGLQFTVTAQLLWSVAEGVVNATTAPVAVGQLARATPVIGPGQLLNVGGGLLTVVLAVEELLFVFVSAVSLETVAVFEIVDPFAVEQLVLTVIVNRADAPNAKFAIVHCRVPPAPTIGGEQENMGPMVCVSEANVVPAGRLSVSTTFAASAEPLFATMIV